MTPDDAQLIAELRENVRSLNAAVQQLNTHLGDPTRGIYTRMSRAEGEIGRLRAHAEQFAAYFHGDAKTYGLIESVHRNTDLRRDAVRLMWAAALAVLGNIGTIAYFVARSVRP